MKSISDISKKIKIPKMPKSGDFSNNAKELEFLNSNLPDNGKKIIDDDNAKESLKDIKN